MSNTDLPSYLETPPSSPSVSPPVETRLQELPFGDLSWENFERLCLRLVRTEAEVEDCRLYGEKGDEQGGIDFYARERNSDKYKLYQCKRVEDFRPSKIEKAVSVFLDGDWKGDAHTFVLCTSDNLRSSQRSDKVEDQRERLIKRNIGFEPWDAHELSEKLKNHPKIVDDFFGRPYVEAFNGKQAAESLEPRLDVKGVDRFRGNLGSFYGSVFQKHDPGLQGQGFRTLDPLPIEERFVLPDIIDQHSISLDEEAADTETPAEEEVQSDFDPQLPDQRFSEYGRDYYGGRDQERSRKRSSTKATYESRQTVEDWLVQSEKSIVLGGPGTGKSALLRFVILDLLREDPTLQKLAQKWGNKLPVWVPFGRWTRMIANSSDPQGSLLELLEQWFGDWEEEASWLSVRRALEDDRLLLLVDGLDEWSNQSAASIALQRLQVFIEQRDLPAVLTSRPQGFKRLEFGGTDWQVGKIAGFSRDQQSELANVWFKHWHKLRSADSDTEKIEKHSREDVETLMRDLRKSRDLAELAEIPLLLSLLIYLRNKQTRLPENRFKAYKVLVEKLVTEHPKQRRRAAEITQDLFPELTDDEVTEIFASLAFSIQKENPEGLIEREEARSLLWDMLEDPEQGLGMSRDKARRTSNKILEIGQSTLGLLVRQSQTQVGFFHRSFLHYLAALHLSRKPREEQIELIRDHCTDPQWREVILSLFFLTRRLDDIETYVETLRSSYDGLVARRTVESLLSEVAFGPFKCSPNLARELATQTFERIETGAWMPHRSELLENAIRGLRSSKTADAVRERIKEWFPLHNRWRESLFRILADSSRSDRVVEFCFRGLHDEEVKNQRSAATALADLKSGEDSIAQQLFDIVEGDYNSDVRASGLEALVEGWIGLDRTESLIDKTRQHTAPQIRLMGIKGKVLLGTQNESGYDDIFDILDGRSFGWGKGMDDLLVQGWSESEGLMERCMSEIRRPGGSRVPWEALIKGYPQNDDVAEFCANELREEEFPFTTARPGLWELLSDNFQEHPKLTPAVDEWIERYETSPRIADIARAALVSRSGYAKRELFDLLDNDRLVFWPAGSLIRGWGMEDGNVARALRSRVKESDKTAAQLGQFLPEIIEDQEKCRKTMLGLLRDPECLRPDFVLDGLLKLADGELDKEVVDAYFQGASSTDDSSMYRRGAKGRVIAHGNSEDERIQELALSRIENYDVGISAVANSYIDHPDLGKKVLSHICPLPASLRGQIARRLGEGAGSNSFSLPLLRGYLKEEDMSVKSLASIGYHERLKTSDRSKKKARETLSSTIVSYGPKLNEKRHAALCGLISMDWLELMLDATEESGEGDEPVSVDVPYRMLEINAPMIRHILSNWKYVSGTLGDELEERLTRRGSDSSGQKLWRTLVIMAEDYPDIQKKMLGELSQFSEEEWLGTDLLRSVGRTRPASDTLLDLCFSILNGDRNDRQKVLTAAQLVGIHFGDNDDVLTRIIPNRIEKPIPEEAIVVLCIGRPESEVLRDIVDCIRGDQRISLATHMHLVCALENPETVSEAISTLEDEHKKSGLVPDSLTLQPIMRRVGSDEDLIQAMTDQLGADASHFEKVNYPRLVTSSVGSSKEILDWCHEEIERQRSYGVSQVALDILAGETRPVIHSLYDAVDASLS